MLYFGLVLGFGMALVLSVYPGLYEMHYREPFFDRTWTPRTVVRFMALLAVIALWIVVGCICAAQLERNIKREKYETHEDRRPHQVVPGRDQS